MVTLADYGMFTEQQLKKSSEKIVLKGLGSQEGEGKLIRDVTIQIGKSTVVWDVCATKLTDKVLLGLDFLSSQKGVLYLKDNNITFADEILPLKLVNTNQGLSVSRVIVPETITEPAFSIKIISVKNETSVNGDYIIEPYVVNKNILISASIGKGILGQVQVINDSNDIVKLNQGKCIGKAESIEEVIDQPGNLFQVRQLKIATPSTPELPDHLERVECRSQINIPVPTPLYCTSYILRKQPMVFRKDFGTPSKAAQVNKGITIYTLD
ncbi:unnamed protein product [Mytilus coruscus]|uniref:Uncharacterized protein n=1 Tax=Mytilus coruscus TaxID=42192 RepID=A0A6J8E985_MYTCO|nr:unnamed protein product [Mytilus coruscus]